MTKVVVEQIEDINAGFAWVYGINWNDLSKGQCWHLVYVPF